jgi:hypothetical protein
MAFIIFIMAFYYMYINIPHSLVVAPSLARTHGTRLEQRTPKHKQRARPRSPKSPADFALPAERPDTVTGPEIHLISGPRPIHVNGRSR